MFDAVMNHLAVSRLEDMQGEVAAGQKNNVQREKRDTFGPRRSHNLMIPDWPEACVAPAVRRICMRALRDFREQSFHLGPSVLIACPTRRQDARRQHLPRFLAARLAGKHLRIH